MLDTHAVLWALSASDKLSRRARDLIEDESNEILVSSVSAIEIAIKQSLGKLRAPQDLLHSVTQAGLTARDFGFAAATALRDLPWHHRDPFDRMLIAHADSENACVISCDGHLSHYAVPIVW